MNRPLKILFLTHKFYPDIGGIEINSEVLAGEFVAAGYEVMLVTWTKEQGDRKFPFEIIRNPGIKELVAAHRACDVVFENNPCLRLSWPRLVTGKPLVVALRTWIRRITGGESHQDKFKLWWLRKALGVIAVSNAVRLKTFSDAVVIGNPYRQVFRQIEQVNRDLPFVFLGRLVSDKGVDIAIKAIQILEDRGDLGNFGGNLLTLIGEGSQKEELRKLAADLGLKERIVFKGKLEGEALVEELNKHRYILVPSVWEEPFGNVALEGMACGCLPVVSNGGGLPDAAGPGGVVFESGNAGNLADSIAKLLSDPEREGVLRAKAEAHLREHQPHKVALRYLEVIEKSVNAAQKNEKE